MAGSDECGRCTQKDDIVMYLLTNMYLRSHVIVRSGDGQVRLESGQRPLLQRGSSVRDF